jgi:hypothetical protein
VAADSHPITLEGMGWLLEREGFEVRALPERQRVLAGLADPSTRRPPRSPRCHVPKEFTSVELERWSMTSDTPVGRLHHLGPVVRLSETPPRWARPSVPLGYHEPAWPARAP